MSNPGAQTSEVCCVEYELEIQFKANEETVWSALIFDTAHWWLGDFHMVGEDSMVEFDLSPGGRGLLEHRDDGSFLQWYAIQAYLPDQKKLYLVGSLAPDFGGPSTSSLSLAVKPTESGSVLVIADAHVGRVSEATAKSMAAGWRQIFGEGLHQYVENK